MVEFRRFTNVTIYFIYSNKFTPLMYAALNNHTAIVEALLERKVDINAKNM